MNNYWNEITAKLNNVNDLYTAGKFEQVWGVLNGAMSPFNLMDNVDALKTDCKLRVADGFLSARLALKDGEPAAETINEVFRSAAHLISVAAIAFKDAIERGEYND